MQHLSIAGLRIGYEGLSSAGTDEMLSAYQSSGHGSPVIVLDPGPWTDRIEDETGQGLEAVEFYALSASLGEQLPLYGMLQTHGVAVEYEGGAYIFAALLRKFCRKVVVHRFRSRLHHIVYGEKFPDSFLKSFAVLRRFAPGHGGQ